jgi:hypothetical protein
MEAAYGARLAQAEAVVQSRDFQRDQLLVDSTAEPADLRRIASTYAGAALARRAEARLEKMRAEARAHQVESGASPESLAACDLLARLARSPERIGLSTSVTQWPAALEQAPGFAKYGREFDEHLLTTTFEQLKTQLGSELAQRSFQLLGGASDAPGGLQVLVTIVLRPSDVVLEWSVIVLDPAKKVSYLSPFLKTQSRDAPRNTYRNRRVGRVSQKPFEYTESDASEHEVTLRAPTLVADLQAELFYQDKLLVTYKLTRAVQAPSLDPAEMASTYPSVPRLYAQQAGELGSDFAKDLGERLCLR